MGRLSIEPTSKDLSVDDCKELFDMATDLYLAAMERQRIKALSKRFQKLIDDEVHESEITFKFYKENFAKCFKDKF